MADVIRSRLAEVEAEIARLEQESAEHSRLGSEKAREAEELRRLAGSLVAGRDNRAAIAYHLASGAKTAKELASLAQLSASTVATHLTALRMAGKVCQSYNGAGRQAYRLIDPSAPPDIARPDPTVNGAETEGVKPCWIAFNPARRVIAMNRPSAETPAGAP